jgi:hypothetical protein
MKRLAAALNKPLTLAPQSRSLLVQQLLQSSQSPQGIVSPAGTANKALQGLLLRKAASAERDESQLREGRQSALAGALSRTQSQDPAQAEAAKHAALIISGGLPEDPMAKALMGAQAESVFSPKSSDRLVGVANPSDFEPESLRKYSQSGDPGVLVPRNNMFGRYTPSNYTPDSWAEFVESGDPSKLVNRGDYRFQTTPAGAIVAGNTVTGQVSPTAVTPEIATAEAAERKRAEAQGAATGQAVGTAEGAILSRALNAEGIDDILDIAEPLIDEATGSGTGAARDKLAAFFGQSTTGAQAIAQLLPLQAAIMLRQPRMEGPQSDRDVQLYREAAGQLGDPNIPGETKKAAIRTIRRIQQQYKQAASPGAPPTGGGSDINSLLDKYAPAR